MFDWIAGRFIAWACVPGRVYRKGHLLHRDGSLYMGRWALFETRWLSARVHHIASDDFDRALHDHPWDFVSLVLSGGYAESRPVVQEPCFNGDTELLTTAPRFAGSLAFRRSTDRHRVRDVMPGTYTLFIYGPGRQWWGFYTRQGKIHWRDFASCHTAIKAEVE